MSTPSHSPYPLPGSEDIQAAIRRAHLERSRAVADFFAALFSWRRGPASEAKPQPPALGATVPG
jgi:hypothetical protein